VKYTTDGIDKFFYEMLEKGLISTGSLWIQRAIAQKNPKLAIGIAHSKLLTIDRLDRNLVALANFN
jgi:hypothetical protein